MVDVEDKLTIVVFSGDLDKVLAAFIIATGAAAMGMEVSMFFTFWGINALRVPGKKLKKTLIEKMFGFMMPTGPNKLTLSKMNMGGMGTAMMKQIMKKKNVASLPELIALAKEMDVHLVVCQMSMDLMGIKEQELEEGIEFGGVAAYIGDSGNSVMNLFI